MKTLIKKALLATLPVMSGYLVLGIGFGIVLKTNGHGILLAFMMSLFIYAGSMQYVAIPLLASSTSLITIAFTTLMVNARHLFYGLSMIEKYKDVGKRKPYLIFALTDETYSLLCQDDSHMNINEKKDYYFLVSFFNHLYWISGTLIGAVLGSSIPFNTEGIDFALTALFVTIFVDQWLTNKNHKPALIGTMVSGMCLLIFGSDHFLIPSMICISVILCVFKEGKR